MGDIFYIKDIERNKAETTRALKQFEKIRSEYTAELTALRDKYYPELEKCLSDIYQHQQQAPVRKPS